MNDLVACLICSAQVRRGDIDAHLEWHKGDTEAMVRTVNNLVVLALMRGGQS